MVRLTFSGHTKNILGDSISFGLFGQKSIIMIPAGFNFEIPKTVTALFDVENTAHNIYFGLGGWAKASGTIQLHDISILKLKDGALPLLGCARKNGE